MNNEMISQSLQEYVHFLKNGPNLTTLDFLGLVLPLCREVRQAHDEGLIAGLSKITNIQVREHVIILTKSHTSAPFISNTVKNLPKSPKYAIDITATFTRTIDEGKPSDEIWESEHIILDREQAIKMPAYIIGYGLWEQKLGTYDQLTEMMQLGQIMASVAYALNLDLDDDLHQFVRFRESGYHLNQELHPTIHRVISKLVKLKREDRLSDIHEVIQTLENYADYDPSLTADISTFAKVRKATPQNRSAEILDQLKRRLFDISKRNKLLYFKSTSSFMNLTESSIPVLLDYKNIREDQILFWQDSLKRDLVGDGFIKLNKHLDLRRLRFLQNDLDRIRLDARRSKQEFGFNQLRLVICMLHWYNYKENESERISSPLLLLPVQITKKKGLQDSFILSTGTSEAEVNPVLSYYLRDLYGIQLPERLDLHQTDMDTFIQSIQKTVASSGTGISLDWRSRPQIQRIYTVARRNRKLRTIKLKQRRARRNLRNYDYNYHSSDFKPLGLAIYNDRIRPRASDYEFLINADVDHPSPSVVEEKQRDLYALDNEGKVNPHVWEADTCNLILGNFSYRKMSLVKDYNDIIESEIHDEVFEELFSEKPKQVKLPHQESVKLIDNYPILPTDPTQLNAINRARSGHNYIIQGPPGTGKSQTITNLVSDFVSRGKNVLFVCEKRAALDVVYHRLKSRGLDDLTCLIHDSQQDKKEFIMHFKETYEKFLEEQLDADEVKRRRTATISKIDENLDQLNTFHATMGGNHGALQLFMEVLHPDTELNEKELLAYPDYASWLEHSEWISAFHDELNQSLHIQTISDYPLLGIDPELLKLDNRVDAIRALVDQLLNQWDQINEELDALLDEALDFRLSELLAISRLAVRAEPLLNSSSDKVFYKDSAADRSLRRSLSELDEITDKLHSLTEKNKNWKNKLDPTDARTALERWRRLDASFFKYLNPGWYKLKSLVKSHYNLQAHQVQPEFLDLLQNLCEEYDTAFAKAEIEEALKNRFFLHEPQNVDWIFQQQQNPHPKLLEWMENSSKEQVKGWVAINAVLENFVANYQKLTVQSLDSQLEDIDAHLNTLPPSVASVSYLNDYLDHFHKAPDSIQSVLHRVKAKPSILQRRSAQRSLNDLYARQPRFKETDRRTLRHLSAEIESQLGSYYDLNAQTLRANAFRNFGDLIRITETSATQLTDEEKSFKKRLRAARRVLENEFGKKMRYKSIRELATGDTMEILTAIKPVWLMSPLSVSDTIQLGTDTFDVVIYDEASQITLEEGVPSLFRTHQTIIVGDEMQMPPTKFFAATTSDDEEQEKINENLGINLEADSLLNQGIRKLSQVRLGWHYRSKSENLISFSNAAFYDRSLLTIPDSHTTERGLEPLPSVRTPEEPADLNQVFQRSISYHYLPHAVYHKRRNSDEASYIAAMVASLLRDERDLSIGVVAFSMDQQDEIESAMEKLAAGDSELADLLEKEYQREEEDQFNGLFVKNLENVQGDERDVIIMSVCYGPNEGGKMYMNFGPINRSGGEKRLNVIFSRARQHMMVVSSIYADAITNDYNEGANYLKKFLAYAKAVSDGNELKMKSILNSMSPIGNRKAMQEQKTISKLKDQVAQKITKANPELEVIQDVGQSYFTCDLAIRKNGSTDYKLGILIDDQSFYENNDILEQFVMKQTVLKAFGWRIFRLYLKDWVDSRDAVIQQILRNVEEDDQFISMGEEDTLPQKPLADRSVQENAIDFPAIRRFEFEKGSSHKFWEIYQNGNEVVTRYGRMGRSAQENRKQLEDPKTAIVEIQRLIRLKLRKGYQEVSGEQ